VSGPLVSKFALCGSTTVLQNTVYLFCLLGVPINSIYGTESQRNRSYFGQEPQHYPSHRQMFRIAGGGGYGSWSLKFKYGSVEVYGRAQDVPVATKMDPMCIDHHLVQSSPTKINVV
jgi:hypothetical protein